MWWPYNIVVGNDGNTGFDIANGSGHLVPFVGMRKGQNDHRRINGFRKSTHDILVRVHSDDDNLMWPSAKTAANYVLKTGIIFSTDRWYDDSNVVRYQSRF